MPRRHPRLAPPPASLGLRFRALLGLGFVPPPEPRPCAHCAPSPTRCSRLPASLYAAIEQIQNRRLGRCHREVPPASPPPSRASLPSRPPRAAARVPPLSRVASAPGPWLARIAPYASLFRRMREKGPLPGSIRPKCMFFEIKMATSSPHASISGRNRAIQDTWRANLAAKGPFPRRGTRNHAWREDVASAARPFRGSGMRHGRTGFAPCGAGLACLPHARPLPSRLCPPPPAFIAAVLCASPFAARIAPTHRAHRCALAGTARAPAPRQPSSSPVPTESRPRASRASSTRGAVCAHPRLATRRASPCRAGSAAVPVIPAKWCGDTIAHTRKLRF